MATIPIWKIRKYTKLINVGGYIYKSSSKGVFIYRIESLSDYYVNLKKIGRCEGFWSLDSIILPPPPDPPKTARWKSIIPVFVERLESLEERASVLYKYPALKIPCLLCRHVSIHTAYIHNGWVWPKIYSHYVSMHGIRPCKDFWQMVVNNTISIPLTIDEEYYYEST